MRDNGVYVTRQSGIAATPTPTQHKVRERVIAGAGSRSRHAPPALPLRSAQAITAATIVRFTAPDTEGPRVLGGAGVASRRWRPRLDLSCGGGDDDAGGDRQRVAGTVACAASRQG